MSNFAQKAFDSIAEEMKSAYFALERLHKSLATDPEDTSALDDEKRRLLIQTTRKYIGKCTPARLSQLYRACSVALIDEEAIIRRELELSPDDEEGWFLPETVITSKYVVYDRICKDAPSKVITYLKSICEKAEPPIFLQAVSNYSEWILACEKRTYIFSLDSVRLKDDVKDTWFSQKDFDDIYDDVQASSYPFELKVWITSQLSYMLQD